MTHEEVEFLISQHFDGTLSADEAEKLRVALESEPSARALFEEHARLDGALKSTKVRLDIDAEWLNAQIAGTIDEAQSRPLRISNWNTFAPMAIAATLLIGVTLGIALLRNSASTSDAPAIANATVTLPAAPRPSREAVVNVSVGVPANMTPTMMTTLFLAEHRGSGRVIIQPAGESHGGPFD